MGTKGRSVINQYGKGTWGLAKEKRPEPEKIIGWTPVRGATNSGTLESPWGDPVGSYDEVMAHLPERVHVGPTYPSPLGPITVEPEPPTTMTAGHDLWYGGHHPPQDKTPLPHFDDAMWFESARSALHVVMLMNASPQLQKAQSSQLHKLKQALKSNLVLAPFHMDGRVSAKMARLFIDHHPHVLLVQHDWAKAFHGAHDYDGESEFTLPYDFCCFEFQILGRRVCAFMLETYALSRAEPGPHWKEGGEPPGDLLMMPFIDTGERWIYLAPYTRQQDGIWRPRYDDALTTHGQLTDAIVSQIRAISISLEAEITETTVVRVPEKLNRAREKSGKLPIQDHHVVDLVHRKRYPPTLRTNGEAKWHPRLHFRRGHWRHYEEHRTWVRWTLVGNPDLGFVDKHYRL